MPNKLTKKLFNKKYSTVETIKNILFVDSGLIGTGWAFWEEMRLNVSSVMAYPTATGVIRSKEKSDWQDKVVQVCDGFEKLLMDYMVEHVCIEMPEYWTSSAKSFASMSKGDSLKLMYLVGAFAQICETFTQEPPVCIVPAAWKGQLPKKVVIRRIQNRFRNEADKIRDHEADAVGMGLSAQGLFGL